MLFVCGLKWEIRAGLKQAYPFSLNHYNFYEVIQLTLISKIKFRIFLFLKNQILRKLLMCPNRQLKRHYCLKQCKIECPHRTPSCGWNFWPQPQPQPHRSCGRPAASRRTAAAGILWKISFSKYVKKKKLQSKEKLEKIKKIF